MTPVVLHGTIRMSRIYGALYELILRSLLTVQGRRVARKLDLMRVLRLELRTITDTRVSVPRLAYVGGMA